MTQSDVASKLGVTPAAVSKWENGSSKPRVEVLFQLAQLLGVRTEELMCGHYISVETIDPEAIKQINERYNYLMKVDAYNTTGVKWRRILAWIIDWNLIGFSVMLLVSIFSAMRSIFNLDFSAAVLIMMFLALLYPICFVLRDLIFGGRSLGKRMLGLIVLDRQTGIEAKAGKCVLRNIFLFILHVDTIIMLASGTTLGDRVAHTVVVQKKELHYLDNDHKIAEINQYTAAEKTNSKKTVLIVVFGLVLAVVLLVSVVLIGLSTTRKTEEYRVAYDYFVESQSFEKLNVDKSKIWNNSYSRITHTNADDEVVTQTAKIGFTVKGKTFLVICHKQNEVWIVCDECTAFS